MRIQDSSSIREMDKKRNNSSPIKNIVKSLFADELVAHEESQNSYQEDVETLRSDIDKAGASLMAEPTLDNFKRFRDLLSTLAKKVNSEAYRLDKFGGTPQNPRYYETITIINREADILYSLIVKENRDNMAITAKVIGIKGLVVDLIT